MGFNKKVFIWVDMNFNKVIYVSIISVPFNRPTCPVTVDLPNEITDVKKLLKTSNTTE